MVVSDTAVFAEDVPSLTVSLRGLVHWEITVHGPTSDLHSGYYGGVVRNPLEALAQILASLKDATAAFTEFQHIMNRRYERLQSYGRYSDTKER